MLAASVNLAEGYCVFDNSFNFYKFANIKEVSFKYHPCQYRPHILAHIVATKEFKDYIKAAFPSKQRYILE